MSNNKKIIDKLKEVLMLGKWELEFSIFHFMRLSLALGHVKAFSLFADREYSLARIENWRIIGSLFNSWGHLRSYYIALNFSFLRPDSARFYGTSRI
jgi:hypothetical protein